ncbi:MAG: dipeptidase [Actinobacteria bacterium]|nr:dipeptidase [Actinomycetota bacterium]
MAPGPVGTERWSRPRASSPATPSATEPRRSVRCRIHPQRGGAGVAYAEAVIPVFDGHNDTLTSEGRGGIGAGRADGHLDLPRMRAGGMRGGIFAVFTPSPGEDEGPLKLAAGAAGAFAKPLAAPVPHPVAAADATAAAGRLARLEREGLLTVAREIGDVDAAFADPAAPPVAVLHLEGAEAIDSGLEALEHWHAAGLRSLGPVWSRANAFATGVQFAFPSSPDIGPGLTAAGRALVGACAELGILVDLSHLNEAGFWDVAGLEAGPLVASHSGAHAVAAASRNLTDAQLDAIAASDGLVGIVFAAPFLRPDFADDPATPLALIVEHARYVADRIGSRHVALGSDFDGATIPAELGDVAGLPKLLEALAAAGFDAEQLADVGWRNWRRVLDAWWR